MRPDGSTLQPLDYTALEKLKVPRPVDRLSFISDHVRRKFVFDLGALDETAIDAKQGTQHWLHARLCEQATRVIGIDNSKRLPANGMKTLDNGSIIHADIHDLDSVVATHGRPDIIVAGELIEHLPDTQKFLKGLKETPSLAGVEFLFSTPNACCWHNVMVGLAGRESMHADHLQIYSYKTLRTLFASSGIALSSLVPCYARFHEMISASRGPVSWATRGFQRTINTLEFISPTLSAGWIGTARL